MINIKEAISGKSYKPEKLKRTIYLKIHFSEFKKQFLEIAKRKNDNYLVDNHNKDIINQVFYWLVGSDKFNGDLSRGLLFIGGFGSGKTTICLIIKELIQANSDKIMRFNSSLSLKDLCFADQLFTIFKCPLIIDEIGKEPKEINNYGTKINPMQELLTERYNYGALTIGTTNYDLEGLKKMYGEYLIERFKEMFNIIIMHRESFRKEIIIN